MIARFLHFYPQYELASLRDGTLSYGEFMFLLGGMFDLENPESTEPAAERIARKTREMAQRKGGPKGRY